MSDRHHDDWQQTMELLNVGDYAGALAEAESARMTHDDPAQHAYAERLIGCLQLILGRWQDGLATLERNRSAAVQPAFPRVTYRKSFPPSPTTAVAVGLLECLALGRTAEELVDPSATAFRSAATARSMRGLERALIEEGSADAAGLVARYRRLWKR